MAQGNKGESDAPDADHEDVIALWRRTVDALVAGGATPAEAIDGANLIVQAERRKSAETAPKLMRTSGVRKRDRR